MHIYALFTIESHFYLSRGLKKKFIDDKDLSQYTYENGVSIHPFDDCWNCRP